MGIQKLTAPAVTWIVLMALAACGPVGQQSPSATPGERPSASPTAAATSTQIAREPAPTAPEAPSTLPCIEFVAASDPGSDSLVILYSTDCLADPGGTPTQLWLWNEKTQEASGLPLPQDARGPRPSSDMERILFVREGADSSQELWVVNWDGSNEQRLASISLDETHQRYPAANSIGFEYGWVSDTQWVFYETRPLFDLELGAFDSVVLLEAATGAAQPVVPAGEVMAYRISPDGTQVGALHPAGVWLMSASDGQLQAEVSLAWNTAVGSPLHFSPDGSLLIVLTDKGIAIVETSTGNSREVLMPYRPWGAGHTPFYMPPLAWRDPSTLMLLLAPAVEAGGEELDVFSELLDWEFGLFSLDTSEATLARTQALRGFYPSALLSPDMNHLGYVRALRDSEIREIYMVDLASGSEVLYASGNEARLIHWGPDSRYFLFAAIVGDQWQVFLGQVDQEPVPLDIRLDDLTWLDEGRFVAKPAASELELHLYTVGGGDTLIAAAQPSP